MSSGVGPNGQPTWVGSDPPNTAATYNELSNFANARGTRSIGTEAQRTAFTNAGFARPGYEWWNTDKSVMQVYTGGAWQLVQPLVLGAIGGGKILLTTAWLTVAQVTAISHGGNCLAEAMAYSFNAASGAERTITYRMLCDGVAISPVLDGPSAAPLSGTPRMPGLMWGKSKPVFGSHVWALQAISSANSSVYVEASMLKVTELGGEAI